MNVFGRLASVDVRDANYLLKERVETSERYYRYWYDNAWWGNQGTRPWCVAYAWLHWVEDGPVTHNWAREPLFAPFDIYHAAQQVDQWPGDHYDGTSVRAGAKILKAKGVISEYRWAWDVDAIVRTILTTGPVVVGTRWYYGMSHPHLSEAGQYMMTVTGRVLGGHAYCLTGVSLGKQKFRIKNSWGRNWGSNGRAYISFDDMQTLLDQNGEACMAFEKHLGE
jgi:hypothetical protein